MRFTPFPVRPCDVAALTVPEFTCDLDLRGIVLLDRVCDRFLDDANRALAWFIRYEALRSWCEHADIADWLASDSAHFQHACELAAAFDLNGDWEFDTNGLRSAVESVAQ